MYYFLPNMAIIWFYPYLYIYILNIYNDFFHASILKKQLSKKAIINSASLKEFNRLSAMKSAIASILNTVKAPCLSWWVQWERGGRHRNLI